MRLRPREIVSDICHEVDRCKARFPELAVRPSDIEALAQYIDGDFLLEQRKTLSATQ